MSAQITDRIYLFGGSGSGTTTLGVALAERLSRPHFDTDQFFWLPTDPAFTQPRPAEERDALMRAAFDSAPRYVLSGSMTNFGAMFFPRFTLAVWVTIPHAVRMERLRARQRRIHGDALDHDPETRRINDEFLSWASGYDEGGLNMRSYATHKRVLESLTFATLHLDGALSTEEQVTRVLALNS